MPTKRLPEHPPRRCVICGWKFWPVYRNTIYCSPACKAAAYRRRKEAARKAWLDDLDDLDDLDEAAGRPFL